MPRPARLPAHFPVGTKYVLEAHGPLVLRYVELPSGLRIELASRRASTCVCAEWQQIGIVPDPSAIAAQSKSRRILIIDEVNASSSSKSEFPAYRKEGVF